MDYGDKDLVDKITFLHNAQVLMAAKSLSPEDVRKIVVEPNNIVARSKDTGVVVSEGQDTKDRTVRVVVSEREDTGGSEDNPIVISTMVLGT